MCLSVLRAREPVDQRQEWLFSYVAFPSKKKRMHCIWQLLMTLKLQLERKGVALRVSFLHISLEQKTS